MNDQIHRVYVDTIEGTTCMMPCPARATSPDTYELLSDDNFEFDEDYMLFEYGPGDTVTAKEEVDQDGTNILTARDLVRSGGTKNDLKRLLYRVCATKPDIAIIFRDFTKNQLRDLLDYVESAGFIYPEIREWVTTNASALEQHLQQ